MYASRFDASRWTSWRGGPFTLFQLFCFSAVLSASTCESELGERCSDSDAVNARVSSTAGKIDLVQDVSFENCSQLLCMSSDGSRPYCTRTCETDAECDVDGFSCKAVVDFGPLACRDYKDGKGCDLNDDGTVANPISYCKANPSVIPQAE